jgi:hypothetical protein
MIGPSGTGADRRELTMEAGRVDVRPIDTPSEGGAGRFASAAAFGIYLVISVAFFGLPVLRHFNTAFIGFGLDADSHMWFLAWWPHAIGHGLNPFVTHAVWAPSGYNLAGSTALPGPALLLTPLTETAGLVVTYNVLILLAPALSAWTAFLLCRHLTRAWWSSLLGGYVFGFSTYELGQLMGHPNLALVCLVPVLVLLVVRRLEGSLGKRRFVLWLALALVGQYLISTEVFFTATLFGVLAFLVAFTVVDGARRRALFATGVETTIGFAIATVPLVPYLYYVVRGLGEAPIYDFYPTFFSTDLANLATPTALTSLGHASFASFTSRFTGNISEQMGYLGAPLLAALVLFAAGGWRSRLTRFLVAMIAVVVVLSLGPTLHVGGAESIPLPWRAVVRLPLFKYALPARFMLYGFLTAAVAVALWLASPAGDRWAAGVRWGLALLAVVALVPNLSTPFWKTPVDVPAFFASDQYRAYLHRDENTLIIPFGANGNSMLWQAETRFYFRMPEGYVCVVPPKAFGRWAILQTFYSGELIPDASRELDSFLQANDVEAIVVEDGAPGAWEELFAHVDATPVHVGGVTLYRVGTGP